MRRSSLLSSTPLFQLNATALPWKDRIALSYDRARAIASLYDLTAEDFLNVSQKYWEFQSDPIHAMDGAAATLLTIHFNLCIGTIAMFPRGQEQVLNQLLSFEISGQYCLTELGHGLDVIHLETTATLLETGELEINTPTETAAKFMPPTTPSGLPCIAVVFARLIVNGADRGIKPILVPLHDGREMHPGIVTKALPPRGGSTPIQHALTYFRNVRVPYTSLLGTADRAVDTKSAFAHNIFRVIVGTLSMGTLALSGMRISCYIASMYSMRRTVVDAVTGQTKPIIEFSTQKIPVLTALAQTLVMDALCVKSYSLFSLATDNTKKHFIAAIFKTTVVQHSLSIFSSLGDRCGAQGLFGVNQISSMQEDVRGAAIAEGDVLGISIRFAIDLILGRVSAPPHSHDAPTTVLSQYEESLLFELRGIIKSSGNHRSSAIESLILPRCQGLIQAVGHRLAVEAAVESGVAPEVIDLYVASVVKQDGAWYTEHTDLTQARQRRMEQDAIEALYPKIQSLVDKLEIADYVTAPIVSNRRWRHYVDALTVYGACTSSSSSRL